MTKGAAPMPAFILHPLQTDGQLPAVWPMCCLIHVPSAPLGLQECTAYAY